MTSSSDKVMATLKKYLKTSALKESARDTFVAYLGKNSTSEDHEAFLEYVDSEFLTNECRKLNENTAEKIGVYYLLDGMPAASKGRPPSLSALLNEDAYQDGNSATYDYYLGEKRTREEELEFRQRLAFIKDMYDMPIDEHKAQSVAEYMLGPEEDGSDEEDESEEEEEEEPSEEEEETSEMEVEEDEGEEEPSEEESDDGRHSNHRHKSSSSHHRSSKHHSSAKPSTSASSSSSSKRKRSSHH